MAVLEPKTMFAIGQLTIAKRRTLQAFTLVELILVMTILCIAITIAAPSMGKFFRGRTQVAESRRVLSLIRYGQSRAVEEGIPMVLWFNKDARVYGIEQDSAYVDNDPKAQQFELNTHLDLNLRNAAQTTTGSTASTSRFNGRAVASLTIRGRSFPAVYFQPDGAFGPASLAEIDILEGQSPAIVIAQAPNGLSYEIAQ
jgi:prepilin-type N-terminal cleavage/methylation domain-containing protein